MLLVETQIFVFIAQSIKFLTVGNRFLKVNAPFSFTTLHIRTLHLYFVQRDHGLSPLQCLHKSLAGWLVLGSPLSRLHKIDGSSIQQCLFSDFQTCPHSRENAYCDFENLYGVSVQASVLPGWAELLKIGWMADVAGRWTQGRKIHSHSVFGGLAPLEKNFHWLGWLARKTSPLGKKKT